MAEQAPEPKVFKIKLPMRLRISSKKKQALNLNVYRNLHFRSLSAQKNKFAKIAKKLLRGIPPLGVITLEYEVCPKSKRRLDIMNVGSIVDKYFSDALTDNGIIEDDDYIHIPSVSFVFGKLVKSEYILVTITEIEPREEAKPMRVLLDREDIQTALTAFVSSLNIPNAYGVRISIVDDEIVAEVTFLEHDAPPPEEEAPKKRGRGGRPKGSKNLPKTQPEETTDVDEALPASADISSPGTDPSPADEASDGDETETDETESKVSSKNLFGDKDDPSSEDDGEEEIDPSDTPESDEPVKKKKKGSIFDA